MLIVPLRGDGVRRSLPWAVLVLIALNVLVHLLRHGDAQKEAEAAAFYRSSVLYRIEPDLYQQWLQQHPAPPLLRPLVQGIGSAPLDERQRAQLAAALVVDGPFLTALESGRLPIPAALAPDQPAGAAWRQARERYAELQRRGLFGSGAFVPREHRPHTWVTSMFLHADPMHLVGNMVFLWLAGALLEALIGGGALLLLFIGTGLASCALSWAMSPGSAVPELGASGAISGVMGALATAYGWRRVPCLFNIGFFAWRGSLPGVALAAVWVAWEALQALFEVSAVNRAAHLGGLLSGALAGLLLARRPAVQQQTRAAPDRRPAWRERAMRQAADLDFEGAARSMLNVVQQQPLADDWTLLWAYGRHVLNTRTGEQVRAAILSARCTRPDVRDALLQLQARLRERP